MKLLKLRILPLFCLTTVLSMGCIKSAVNGSVQPLAIQVEFNNNRVLIWNTLSTANRSYPAVVLGQPYFTTSTANYGGVSAQSLFNPTGFCTDGTTLAVVDQHNNRVLIWKNLPTLNFQVADLVLGQPATNLNGINAGAGIGNPTAQTFYVPGWCAISGGRLFIADGGNSRTLIFNSIPTVNQQAADVVLGQPNMSTGVANNGGISAQTHNLQGSVVTDGVHLAVADYFNNRVLLWNSIPSVNQQPADLVLGQLAMNVGSVNGGLGAGAATAQTMQSPHGVAFIAGRFFVTDRGNHRILGWNSVPTVIDQAADFILGQSSPNGVSANAGSGTPSSQTLNQPIGISFDGTRVFIADAANNRIIGYNSIPSTNFQAADFVYGQSTMAGGSANGGAGVSALSISGPQNIFFNDNLFGTRTASGY